MAHFTLTRSDGWPNSTFVTRANLESLDAKVFAAVNGDRGGAWAPSSPIVLSSNSGGALHLTGPLVLWGAGGLGWGQLTTTGNALVVLDNGDFPQLGASHRDRTRTFVVPCIMGEGYPSFGVRMHLPYTALQVVVTSFRLPSGAIQPTTWRVPLRVANGGTLSQVAVTYRMLLGTPRMRVERVDAGGIATALTSAKAGADANGFVTVVPSTTTTEAATGLPALNEAILAVDGGADPANALVDTTAYTYWLRVVEDQSLTSYPSRLPVLNPVRLATTGSAIALSGLGTLDGVSLVAGDRVLVKDNTDPTKPNDIYTAASGAWQLAADSPTYTVFYQGQSMFPAGLVVPVTEGATNGATHWEMQQSSVSQIGAMTFAAVPTNPLAPSGAAFSAIGNLYYAATVTMTGIADDRWQ